MLDEEVVVIRVVRPDLCDSQHLAEISSFLAAQELLLVGLVLVQDVSWFRFLIAQLIVLVVIRLLLDEPLAQYLLRSLLLLLLIHD
jgi:hypothetical protein